MHVHLPFVVDRPPGVKVAVALGGLERGGMPFVQGIGGLHIVMAIGQAGWLACGMQPVSINQRVTGGFDDPDMLQANPLHLPGQALGGKPDVARMLGEGRDRRNAEQRFQFLKEASLLAAGKIERGGHEMYPKPEELLHA